MLDNQPIHVADFRKRALGDERAKIHMMKDDAVAPIGAGELGHIEEFVDGKRISPSGRIHTVRRTHS
jgi:hypothetical protein